MFSRQIKVLVRDARASLDLSTVWLATVSGVGINYGFQLDLSECQLELESPIKNQ
jgi:hypothetical protein